MAAVTGIRRWAAGFLSVALLLAVGTPAWVAYAEPSLAGYLLHASVFLLQGLPYVVAAALWVPGWAWGSETMTAILSFLLLLAAVWLYVPVVWSPGRWGGDMIGLAFIAISGVTTAAVLVSSGLMALVSWLRRRIRDMKGSLLALGLLALTDPHVGLAQEPTTDGGLTTVGGVEIRYSCTPVPVGAERFYVEAVYSNSNLVRPPDLPDYTKPIPGLVAGMAGTSDGSGTGEGPMREFTLHSKWSAYRPGMVIAAEHDVFSTAQGDVFADELFRAVPETEHPNMTFVGEFTITGGIGSFKLARGSAASVAQQLGDGVRSAFVACGWISGAGA